MRRELWIWRIVPGLILIALWLNGWFFPLILLPILYVLLVEKKSLEFLGFSRRKLHFSLIACILIDIVLIGMYYPIFLYYLPEILKRNPLGFYGLFLDVVWYPVYEELAYRSFALTHFADLKRSCLSARNLIVNLSQSLLFLSIHKHHFSISLVLVPVFFLAFLNGLLFLRTRNIYGCILSHSVLNGFALLLRSLQG